MRAEPSISAEDVQRLVAYVDGELNSEGLAKVDAQLENDPQVRRLADELSSQADLLRNGYMAVLNEPLPTPLLDRIATYEFATIQQRDAGDDDIGTPTAPETTVSRKRQTTSRAAPATARRIVRLFVQIAATVALVFAATGGGYLLGRFQNEPTISIMTADMATPLSSVGWLDDVVGYHRMYAAERRHRVEVGADETDHIQAWLGKRLDRSLTVPDLSEAGLVFEGARLLQIDGRPVAQLMYLSEDHVSVGLCVTPTVRPDLAYSTVRRAEMNVLEWRSDGFAYALVSQIDAAELTQIADHSMQVLAL